MSNYQVEQDTSGNLFVVRVDGYRSVLDYRLDGGVVHMTHVGVPVPMEGRGIASALTRAALDWAREQELAVVPRCPYVAAWIKRHPEYQSLVHAG